MGLRWGIEFLFLVFDNFWYLKIKVSLRKKRENLFFLLGVLGRGMG